MIYTFTKLMCQALENERTIDNIVAHQYLKPNEISAIPEFKQLKLSPLKKRLGIAFHPALFFVVLLVWPKLVLEFLLYCVVKVFTRTSESNRNGLIYFAFLETREDLLQQVLNRDEGYAISGLTKRQTIGCVSFAQLFAGFRIVLGLAAAISERSWRDKVSLSLHAHNAPSIILACLFLNSHRDVTVVSTSIMQRWLYMFGHIGQHVWVVQHGFIRTGVALPYKFSDIERIHAFSEQQAILYKQYYTADEVVLIKSGIELAAYKNCDRAIFLASSFPFIDQEIELLQKIRKSTSRLIAVKLHPRHLYDNRVKVLLDLSDIIVPADVNPVCAIFLSHSSSYGFFYERNGISAFAFSEYKNLDELLCVLREADPLADV